MGHPRSCARGAPDRPGPSEQVGDGVEGDACGGGFEGGKHGSGGEGASAVFVIELVHGGEEAGAAFGVFECVEEVERVEPVGDEAGELHADEVGLIVFTS